MSLTRRSLALAVLGSLATPAARASGGAIALAQICALSGADARTGDEWRNGVEMGAVELNARGGILGRPVQLSTYDTQSSPAAARTAALRALDGDPLALLGPMAAGTTLAIAPLLRERRVAGLSGSDAAAIAGQNNPFLFQLVPGPAARMAKLARWVRDGLGGRRIALLWSTQEAERTRRDLLARELRALGLDVAADVALLPPLPGQPSVPLASEIARITQASADAVYLGVSPDLAPRALVELRRQAPALPVFGEAPLFSRHVLDQAGGAAIGARAHFSLTADAPLPGLGEFRERFRLRFAELPGAAAMQGYMAIATVSAAATALGRPDPHALADALRGLAVTVRQEPGILIDTTWSAAGEPDRMSFIAELRAGGERAWSMLPPLRG